MTTRASKVSEQATSFIPTGKTGATAASQYAGATVMSAPTTGTWEVGDFVIAQQGTIWICVVAGTPGTWQRLTRQSDLSFFMAR